MNETLIGPIQERIKLGYSKEAIKNEVLGFGYTVEEFESSFAVASVGIPVIDSTPIENSSTPTPTPTTNNRRKFLVRTAVVTVSVLMGGAMAFAYQSGLAGKILPSFFFAAPFDDEHIVNGLVDSFSRIESASYTASVSVLSAPRDPDAYPLPKKFTTASETYNDSYTAMNAWGRMVPKDFKLVLSVAGNLALGEQKLPDSYTKISGDIDTEDFKLNIDLEFIVTEVGDFFFRVNRLPSLFFDVSGLRNEWVKITAGEMGRDISQEISKKQTEQGTHVEQLKLLASLADKHLFIEVVGNPVKEDLRGETAYKYHLRQNPQTAKEFYQEALKLLGERYGEESILSQGDIEQKIERYSDPEFVEYYNQHVPLYVWARKNGTIARVEVDARIVPESSDVPSLSDRQVNVLIAVDLDNMNEPVVVSIPEKALTLEEAAKRVPVLQSLMLARSRAEEAMVKASLGMLRAEAELYYDQNARSYLGLCGSEETSSILSTIYEKGQEASCNDAVNAYMVEATLGMDSYYCVDSTGFAGELWVSSADKRKCLSDF